jgi:hypothetical protein
MLKIIPACSGVTDAGPLIAPGVPGGGELTVIVFGYVALLQVVVLFRTVTM